LIVFNRLVQLLQETCRLAWITLETAKKYVIVGGETLLFTPEEGAAVFWV